MFAKLKWPDKDEKCPRKHNNGLNIKSNLKNHCQPSEINFDEKQYKMEKHLQE